ncbi:hypothetical protein CEXT_736491 [Caerostris extrusa]|uniref:Uncharacterized protein n=1 Tax=Caerostris extrusa TaxID=172846 RepID=A0AAV4MGS9_CAEEX|nr:hypothetical protein CEXT_736491 [Caerostris extrusa]
MCFVCHALGNIEQMQMILYFFKKNDECEQCVPAPVFCSVCEVPSMCIASSTVWIEDEVEKALYFEAYKRSVSKISCPWMRFGQGKCLSLKCGIKANDWKERRR